MLEVILCSVFTILPDYLFRRYGQGKRFGHEITLYSVWYELRWGITTCLMLTVLLITIIFYYHPSTSSAVSFFRTVPILPEAGGRVAEVLVGVADDVEEGQPLFRLDASAQRAALERARRRVEEIDAETTVARTDLAASDGRTAQARGALREAADELAARREVRERNAGAVPEREIERLEAVVESRQGAVDAALAEKAAVEARLSTLLPAQRASAEAALAEAQVALDKTEIRAGFSGRVEQFTLRPGDFVSPIMRPAGLLIPAEAGRRAIEAGFGQIEAQVLKVGMVAEVACMSMPLTIIPMVVTDVQDFIASGQVGAAERLLDAQNIARPGTILVYMEPLFEGGLEGVPPGSNCIANAYTNNHDRLAGEEMGAGRRLFLHAIDTVGVVHAMILRVQALMMPVRTLVLTGH